MRHVNRVFFTIILAIALLSSAGAEVSSVSVERREKEIKGLIKECVTQKNMGPKAAVQLQNHATSSFAQPAVSALAQPHQPLSIASLLDIIKNYHRHNKS
jgi:hypothetical protein